MDKIKNITYKNLSFNKNISSKGGALYKCIDEKEDQKNIIHIDNKNSGKLWGQATEGEILKLIEKNIGLYEVITHYPCKVYFDIDGDKNASLVEIKAIINKYFTNCLMSISGYEIENKNSYHIILNNYIINNVDELQHLKVIVKYFYSLNSNFDWKVYTKNRNMKAINQSKRGKETQKIIEDSNYKNHLITCFINPNSYNINNILLHKLEEKKLEDLTTDNYIDWSDIKKLELELPPNFNYEENYSLLLITPLNNTHNHAYTWRVARFCFYNGLTFEQFIAWYKNKSDSKETLIKWARHWKLIKNHPEITRRDYIKFLSNFYPRLNKENYNEFKSLFKWSNNIKYIDRLSQEDFIFNEKCKIINIGMGGGKTTQTIDYLKKLEDTLDDYLDHDSFIWITPNISLAENTYSRIKEAKINCNIYNSAKNKKDKQELIETSKNIIICLNSLFYTKKTEYNSYEVVVIDEIETFLKLFNNNSTIKELDQVFKKFINILKHCKKLILLDAFISKITINFLEDLGINYEVIKRTKEPQNREAIIKKDFNLWMSDIMKDLKNNKKLLIFYPLKNPRKGTNPLPSMADLVETIKAYTNKKGIFHNADSSCMTNSKLKDVNEHWTKYDFIVANNKINVGLNFDKEYFDTCYLSIAAFNSPRDIIQFSYRTRNLKSNTIKYCYLDSSNNIDCSEIETVAEYNEIFKNLNENIVIEKMADLKPTFNYFLDRANYNITNENIYNELEPIKFLENDYYDYLNVPECDCVELKDYENAIYCQEASIIQKLQVKKHYFNNLFTIDTEDKILSDLWNNNKFNLISKIKKILYNDEIITQLKNNYKWTCMYPDKIDVKFKFDVVDLETIFKNYKFKYLTQKSKDHLILTSYINNIYGQYVIKKTTKNKNCLFSIDEKFENYYIQIVDNIKPEPKKEVIEFI